MSDDLIEFNKFFSEVRKKSKVTECFYHKKEKCKGKIKQTHSIQKNGRLSIIEGDIKGNKVIYAFTGVIPSSETLFSDLKPIGKNEASTFFGFCEYHDNVLFSTIENNAFDNSKKHCFLHSYRAFAHSYIRKKEEIKAYETESQLTKALPNGFIKDMKLGMVLGLNEIQPKKKILDEIIENKTFDKLEYLTYTKNGLYPIACSSIICPKVSYYGNPMNNHTDPNKLFSHIMLTVLPDIKKSIIILACFPEDKDSILFFNEINNLNNNEFEFAISSLLISCAENTFFSPSLWNKLGYSGKKQLLDELLINNTTKYMNNFFMTKINFFNKIFCEEN